MSTATSFVLFNTKLVAVEKLNIHINLKKPSLNAKSMFGCSEF